MRSPVCPQQHRSWPGPGACQDIINMRPHTQILKVSTTFRWILWKSALNRVDTLNSWPAHLTKSSLMFSARHTISSSLLISSRGVSIFKCNCCFVVGNRNNIYYLLYLWQPVYGVVSRIVVLQCFVSSKSIVNLDKFVHGCSAWAFDECVFRLWAEDVLVSLEKKSFHGLENMFVHHWVIHSKSVNNGYWTCVYTYSNLK